MPKAKFANDSDKQQQWQAFLSKNGLQAPSLADVIQTLHDFLWPTLLLAAQNRGDES